MKPDQYFSTRRHGGAPPLAAWEDAQEAPRIGDRRERLERWAMLLEREPYRFIGLLRPSWAAGDDLTPLIERPSAIDIAWNDSVFRVIGLQTHSREGFKSFFGLSNFELDRIIAGSSLVRVRRAWEVAAQIRNVANSRGERMLVMAAAAMVIVLVGIAQWLR